MPTKDEKRRRRELTSTLAAEVRAADEARMPFSKETLSALLDHLDTALFEGKRCLCDHTLRRTQSFMTDEHAWSDAARQWLGDHGGFCDCEVVFNVGNWADGGL